MSKSALAGKQEAIGREMCERRLQTLADDFWGFDRIAALVNHAARQIALEGPLFPQFNQVVAESAVLHIDIIDLDGAEVWHDVGILREINPLSPGVATADVQPEPDPRQRI